MNCCRITICIFSVFALLTRVNCVPVETTAEVSNAADAAIDTTQDAASRAAGAVQHGANVAQDLAGNAADGANRGVNTATNMATDAAHRTTEASKGAAEFAGSAASGMVKLIETGIDTKAKAIKEVFGVGVNLASYAAGFSADVVGSSTRFLSSLLSIFTLKTAEGVGALQSYTDSGLSSLRSGVSNTGGYVASGLDSFSSTADSISHRYNPQSR